jgi:hypothetical protein
MEDKVRFVDMAEVGSNPVRIIPVWREFVDEHAESGVRLRGDRRADLGGAQP